MLRHCWLGDMKGIWPTTKSCLAVPKGYSLGILWETKPDEEYFPE